MYDVSAYNSKHWYTTAWAKNPEDAIGITKEALDLLLKSSKLELVQYYPGNWKEKPGVYFQDVLIFEKKALKKD